ncbi:hypothetical protein BDP27DRAFT_1299060 [Rhodocollybia butyracea]|uniref:DUF6534 domain-containing protein n=1 Tax=Rhodocollybia butyracea TaxID=206335 RepID=A0A9P5PI27_9AGAR|nr:hypothetical protein BDP27DRAFT_1299060 [Rhodocollybia butyracea]
MASMNTTFGMLFNAVVVGSALYGAGCLQGYMYYRKYQRDPWYLKALVGFILVCDTFQVGILSACLYQYVILNFANQEILGILLNTLIIEIFFSDAIGLAVQMFYCWRVWRLSNGSYLVVAIPVLLSWAAFASLAVYSSLALRLHTYAELASLKNLSMSCNILAAASDISISVAMVFFLQRSKTAYKETNHIINRLIVFTFNAGIPVSVCALLACISINVWPSTFIYIFFFLLQGRLYTNSLLVTLNCREYTRRGTPNRTEATSYVMHSYHDNHRFRNDDIEAGKAKVKDSEGVDESQPAISIKIDTITHTEQVSVEDGSSF